MSMDAPDKSSCPLLELPAELIQQVLASLSPVDLSRVSQTCRLLCNHAADERLWKPIILANTHSVNFDAHPPSSWRKLFAAHHPYWFLTRRKLWFSDGPHTGKLLLARFNPQAQAIEAYAVTAERGQNQFELWEHNPDVIIHTFSPKVQLDHNGPVVKLDSSAYSHPFGEGNNMLQKELMMDVHTSTASHGLFSMFMLARPVPYEIISPGTKVWPPLTIPAPERTRNESVSRFRGTGHKPFRFSEISETTWRLRKWMEFQHHPHGITARVGEDVTTFATLDEELYTPTEEKPWRGIWCGDYAGHGCEFLLVLQPDDPNPLPEGAQRAMERRRGSVSSSDSWTSVQSHLQRSDDEEDFVDVGGSDSMDASTTTVGEEHARGSDDRRQERSRYSGRVEAVKLTGDPNIPRGEYTFIAPDIGPDGFIRTAEEEIFRGARIVRSVGHIAARGFREDEFIPSQLIMISHDRLAQYWEPFGHISFYQRVDVNSLVTS